MKTLSRKNKVKALKQQLIDKINEVKTLKELEGWRKTFAYHDVLKKDEDWDQGFFFDLIEFKLKRMRDYFWTHNIVVNEKYYGDICQRLINLLNAGYKTDIILSGDLNSYVNSKNAYRFLNEKELTFLSQHKLEKYFLPSIREAKAKYLFWKCLYYNIELLWD